MKPKHRHSLRDGFNKLYRARPGETGFCVTVTCRSSSARLAPAARAPGRHAFAVRNLQRLVAAKFVASIASRPAIVTTRSPLFIEAGRGQRTIIFRKTEEEYFSLED